MKLIAADESQKLDLLDTLGLVYWPPREVPSESYTWTSPILKMPTQSGWTDINPIGLGTSP